MKSQIKMIITIVLFLFINLMTAIALADSILNANEYRRTVQNSRQYIQQLLAQLQAYREQSHDVQIAFIMQQLADIPYSYREEIGEGDWQPRSWLYQPGALHVNQNPVYRSDTFDCQSLVQFVMALLYAHNLAEFDRHYLQIAYGAAGNPHGEIVHYYNRNNFIDADFNPINERNGFLFDATSFGDLANDAAVTAAIINRQSWFKFQEQNLVDTVQVLNEANLPAMQRRFTHIYENLPFAHFSAEKIMISYIPKNKLAIKRLNGYRPNQVLFDKIKTPAIIEIVNDVNTWSYHGTNIRFLIGSELNVSHLGFLYRQTFHHDEIIYQKITCQYEHRIRVCHVKPIKCSQAFCNELMFAHATDAYPRSFYWYQQADGSYACSPNLPAQTIHYSQCSRVERLPFFSYLTDYQYGSYLYMNDPSILGVHIEQLRQQQNQNKYQETAHFAE